MQSKTKKITLVGVLSALAIVLYFIEFSLFVYFPPYLKIDLSDIPAILGGIALGPMAGVLIELIKNILHFLIGLNPTSGAGELANFFAGSGLLIPIAYIIRSHKLHSVAAYTGGILAMTLVANVMNYFIVLPMYGIANKDILPQIVSIFIPFNLVKGILVSLLTAALYARLKGLLRIEKAVQH